MNESRRQILRMRANINRVKSEIIACIKLIAPCPGWNINIYGEKIVL